ncbi:MAG: hypothetical protein ABI813_02765 [Bacteroidota bacterium]
MSAGNQYYGWFSPLKQADYRDIKLNIGIVKLLIKLDDQLLFSYNFPGIGEMSGQRANTIKQYKKQLMFKYPAQKAREICSSALPVPQY